MNCDQFAKRMNECLDQRQQMDDDVEIGRHARNCQACRAKLRTWSRVASILPAGDAVAPRRNAGELRGRGIRSLMMITSLAAAGLLILGIGRWGSDQASPDVGQQLDTSRPQQDTVLAQAAMEIDPTMWWRRVQNRDWVGQTMPTVNSVREGVAPIGRSLLRAVAILAGGREQTS